MEKILFILGAGFSAPLGLPVMSNFLTTARDMSQSGIEKYAYFKPLLKKIKALESVGHYINCDVTNIEDILSILEMDSFTQGNKLDEDFKNMLKDVIQYHTPSIELEQKDINNQYIFTVIDRKWRPYHKFLPHIFNFYHISHGSRGRATQSISVNPKPKYNAAIISLNYDLVIEAYHESLKEYYSASDGLPALLYSLDEDIEPWTEPKHFPIAKIHGSIHDGSIVPPTWNKTQAEKASGVWRLANKLIETSNHIIFLGYSMPSSDFYMKYLLTVGLIKSEHLKSIMAICLDKDDEVNNRYKEIINFNKFTFVDSSVEEYFRNFSVQKHLPVQPTGDVRLEYNDLLNHLNYHNKFDSVNLDA